MKIHEYQAKALLKEVGVLSPPGFLAINHVAAQLAAVRLGFPVMIKAQVLQGGRGKAGLIKSAGSPLEVMDIVAGLCSRAQKFLVEKKADIAKEFYLAIMADRSSSCPVIIASSEGGVDIEQIAKINPEKIYKEYIDPFAGLQAFQKRKIACALNIAPSLVPSFADILSKLYRFFEINDCLLVEINPFVLDQNGQWLALDAKVHFDDNAIFRHPEWKEMVDISAMDILEAEAFKHSSNYVRLSGNIGCLVNGAGLSMATMDTIKALGGEPANFLDIGGGASLEQVETGLRIILADKSVKVLLINVFGGIMRIDVLAQGLVNVMSQSGVDIPLVLRLEGDDRASGMKIMQESGVKFIEVKSLREGVKKAIQLTEGQK